METQICISKSATKALEDLDVDIFYLHPKITITASSKYTFLGDENDHEKYCSETLKYAFDSTLENILESNKIEGSVNVEYLIMCMKNTDSVTVDEDVLIFTFPLQLNCIDNVVKIVCTRYIEEKNLGEVNFPEFDSINSKILTSRIIELDSKYNELKMEVDELRKISKHVVINSTFDEQLHFSEYTTSLHLTLENLHEYKHSHKLVFPHSILYLKIVTRCYILPIEFPPNLIGLDLEKGFSQYNHLLDIPDTVENLRLDKFHTYTHPLELPKSLKTLSITEFHKFDHPINIPNGTEKVNMGFHRDFNSTIAIPESVTMFATNFGDKNVENSNIEIKCYSHNDGVIDYVISLASRCRYILVYLPKNKNHPIPPHYSHLKNIKYF